jgi:hypothetical protein
VFVVSGIPGHSIQAHFFQGLSRSGRGGGGGSACYLILEEASVALHRNLEVHGVVVVGTPLDYFFGGVCVCVCVWAVCVCVCVCAA